MYAVYDDEELSKIDFTQVQILFIGFAIAAYIWVAMGIDVSNPDGVGTYRFFNDILPAVIDHGITTNVGYFFWRMIDAFGIPTILTSLFISGCFTGIAIMLITNIMPSKIIV